MGMDNMRMDRGFLAIILAGALGGAAAVGLMEAASVYSSFPLSYIPFATSIVVVMGSPEAPPAQPRALIGGHLISTLIGLAIVKLAGPGPWLAALAVGLSIVAMHLTRTFHPPAGIDPLIVVLNDLSWPFLAVPVAVGACALALFAFVWHAAARRLLGRASQRTGALSSTRK
jgi:CBS-domain-containing membrane protein